MGRWMSIGLVCTLVLLIAACGSGNGNKKGGNNSGVTITSTTPTDSVKRGEEELKPITLKIYGWWTEQAKASLENTLYAFNQLHPHITVEPVHLVPGAVSVDNLQKLDVAMSAGEQVDVMMLPNVDEIMKRAEAGVLEPLNDYYEQAGIDPEAEYLLNPVMNNSYYATLYEASKWMVMLNKQHLDEVGLPVPTMGWTWEEFREYAKKLTTDEHKGAFFYTWGEYANPIAYAELPHPYLSNEETPIFDHPSYEAYFKLRKVMEQEDKSVKSLSEVVSAKLGYANEFLTGQASMLMSGSWMIGNIRDDEKYPHDFITVFAPLPRSSASAEVGNTILGGNFYAIGADSKYKQESFALVRFLTTDGGDTARTSITGWKLADSQANLNALIGGAEALFDVDSLAHTLYHDQVKTAQNFDINISFGSELKKVLENGLSQYLLDGVDVTEVVDSMMKEAQRVIQRNK